MKVALLFFLIDCTTCQRSLYSWKLKVNSILAFQAFQAVSQLYLIVSCCSFFTFNFKLSTFNWYLWRIRDSNPWPPACKAGALASWANPPNLKLNVQRWELNRRSALANVSSFLASFCFQPVWFEVRWKSEGRLFVESLVNFQLSTFNFQLEVRSTS